MVVVDDVGPPFPAPVGVVLWFLFVGDHRLFNWWEWWSGCGWAWWLCEWCCKWWPWCPCGECECCCNIFCNKFVVPGGTFGEPEPVEPVPLITTRLFVLLLLALLLAVLCWLTDLFAFDAVDGPTDDGEESDEDGETEADDEELANSVELGSHPSTR